jgi:glycosyltransferase involved in cell wall biosynthesis
MHLILNGWFWGQLTTGSGQYLQALVEHLPPVAPHHAYTLILPRAGPQPAKPPLNLQPTAWQIYTCATPFDGLGDNLAKLWFEQVSFPLACRRLGADVALTPYWGSSAWKPCATAVTVHDLIPLLLPAYRGGLKQQLYTRLARWTARRADMILTDSRASQQDIAEHLSIPPQRVHAVLLAAAAPFRPVSDSVEMQRVRDRYGLPRRFILYLGGFDVRKNVLRLVQAYARWQRQQLLAGGLSVGCADAPHLVIAGRLPEAETPFAPDPRRAVAAEGIGEWVHFTGWVDEADKPGLYSLAAVFAFPSLYEGFGLPVAEAAACGASVVTSNRSSLPEAAAGAVLVNPEDVEDIAAGLSLALQRAPAAVASRRTWADVAAETVAVLEAAKYVS